MSPIKYLIRFLFGLSIPATLYYFFGLVLLTGCSGRFTTEEQNQIGAGGAENGTLNESPDEAASSGGQSSSYTGGQDSTGGPMPVSSGGQPATGGSTGNTGGTDSSEVVPPYMPECIDIGDGYNECGTLREGGDSDSVYCYITPSATRIDSFLDHTNNPDCKMTIAGVLIDHTASYQSATQDDIYPNGGDEIVIWDCDFPSDSLIFYREEYACASPEPSGPPQCGDGDCPYWQDSDARTGGQCVSRIYNMIYEEWIFIENKSFDFNCGPSASTQYCFDRSMTNNYERCP